MSGGRALLQAPLVILFALLTTCSLDFKLSEPALYIEAKAAYASAENIIVRYKFTVDEPILRCRIILSKAGAEILRTETGNLSPNIWYERRFDVPSGNGLYSLQLDAQALRGTDFVDLPFLSKTIDFYIDTTPPLLPPYHDHTDVLPDGFHIYLNHQEWSEPGDSPVMVYYTINGSGDPDQSSPVCNRDTGIIVPLGDFNKILKAQAFDLAGNKCETILIQNPLFPDGSGPVHPPEANIPDNQRYVGDLAVSLSHEEWTTPTGSPVLVYYTLDGTDPLASGTLYDDPDDGISPTPIMVYGSVEFRTLRIAAKDEAGNSGAQDQLDYKFMKIIGVNPTSAPKGQLDITLTGFGFDKVSSIKNIDVGLFDRYGTRAYTKYNMNITLDAILPDTIEFNVDMNDPVYGSIFADSDVLGRIFVTCPDPVEFAATASIEFTITE